MGRDCSFSLAGPRLTPVFAHVFDSSIHSKAKNGKLALHSLLMAIVAFLSQQESTAHGFRVISRHRDWCRAWGHIGQSSSWSRIRSGRRRCFGRCASQKKKRLSFSLLEEPAIRNRMRYLRRARALTQQDLGDLLGVSRQTVNAIENGRYEPGLRLAFNIAAVFAARIEDVFRPIGSDKPEWSTTVIVIPESLSADKAILRPHLPSDLPAFETFLLDDQATRFMAFTPEQKSKEGAANMMDAVISSYSGPTPICSLTIADRETNAYLGSAGAAEAGDGKLEVFVTLLSQAQGKGLAREAMQLLAAHLFQTSGAAELIADVVAENGAAIRLFESLGYRKQRRIKRNAEEGALGHREMEGLRLVLTRERHRKAEAK